MLHGPDIIGHLSQRAFLHQYAQDVPHVFEVPVRQAELLEGQQMKTGFFVGLHQKLPRFLIKCVLLHGKSGRADQAAPFLDSLLLHQNPQAVIKYICLHALHETAADFLFRYAGAIRMRRMDGGPFTHDILVKDKRLPAVPEIDFPFHPQHVQRPVLFEFLQIRHQLRLRAGHAPRKLRQRQGLNAACRHVQRADVGHRSRFFLRKFGKQRLIKASPLPRLRLQHGAAADRKDRRVKTHDKAVAAPDNGFFLQHEPCQTALPRLQLLMVEQDSPAYEPVGADIQVKALAAADAAPGICQNLQAHIDAAGCIQTAGRGDHVPAPDFLFIDVGQIQRRALAGRALGGIAAVHLNAADPAGSAERIHLQHIAPGNRAGKERAGHHGSKARHRKYAVDRKPWNPAGIARHGLRRLRGNDLLQLRNALPGNRGNAHQRRIFHDRPFQLLADLRLRHIEPFVIH